MMRWSALAVLVVMVAGVPLRGETVELSSGEVLKGRVAERSAELIVLDHAILGRLEIPIVSVRRIDGRAIAPAEKQTVKGLGSGEADGGAAKAAGAAEGAEAAALSPAEPAERPGATWDSQIEVGATAQEGTTEDANVRVGLRSERKSRANVTRLDASYRLATTQGDRTENSFTAGVFSEWPWPSSRFSAFAQGRFESDEFESWDSRVTGAGGLGYRIFDVKAADGEGGMYDRFLLTGRVGAGVRREFGSENEDWSPEGLLGADYTWGLSPRQRIVGTTTLYPDLNTTEEFRVVSSVDWTIDIDQLDGISLKLGLAHEYESVTEGEVPHNDLTAHVLMVVDF